MNGWWMKEWWMDGWTWCSTFLCSFPSAFCLRYYKLSFYTSRPCNSKSIHLFKGMCSFYLSFGPYSCGLYMHVRLFITEVDLFGLSSPDCTHALHEADVIYYSRSLYASISVSFLFLCKEKSLYKRTGSPRGAPREGWLAECKSHFSKWEKNTFKRSFRCFLCEMI